MQPFSSGGGGVVGRAMVEREGQPAWVWVRMNRVQQGIRLEVQYFSKLQEIEKGREAVVMQSVGLQKRDMT